MDLLYNDIGQLTQQALHEARLQGGYDLVATSFELDKKTAREWTVAIATQKMLRAASHCSYNLNSEAGAADILRGFL